MRVIIAVLAMLVMPGIIVHPSEAITCLDVSISLQPCLAYLTIGGTPPPECCDGVKRLKAECQTRSDRQIACSCAKAAAIRLQLRPEPAEQLADKCGVTVSFPISPTVDCSSVSLMHESYK